MKEIVIIKIYNKGLKKYWECSYGAFLKNWGNYGWVIVNKQSGGGIGSVNGELTIIS